MEIERKKRLQEGANEWEAARWKAVEAPKSGIWLDAPPDRNSGLRMSNAEIRSRVSRRLGRKICDGGPCPLCFGVMDEWGVHAECCTSGGDKTIVHDGIKHDIFKQSRLARFGPQLEKGVDKVLGLDSDGREK